jgi:hypothetical protein
VVAVEPDDEDLGLDRPADVPTVGKSHERPIVVIDDDSYAHQASPKRTESAR